MNFDKIMTSLVIMPSASLRHQRPSVVERSRNHANEESADILNSILELI
jgi:hypothetical protein